VDNLRKIKQRPLSYFDSFKQGDKRDDVRQMLHDFCQKHCWNTCKLPSMIITCAIHQHGVQYLQVASQPAIWFN